MIGQRRRRGRLCADRSQTSPFSITPLATARANCQRRFSCCWACSRWSRSSSPLSVLRRGLGAVSQRRREIGLRMAIGITRRCLPRVLSGGMKLAIVGVVLGVVAALRLARFVSTMLFDVAQLIRELRPSPRSSAAVAAVACYVPAAPCASIPSSRCRRRTFLIAVDFCPWLLDTDSGRGVWYWRPSSGSLSLERPYARPPRHRHRRSFRPRCCSRAPASAAVVQSICATAPRSAATMPAAAGRRGGRGQVAVQRRRCFARRARLKRFDLDWQAALSAARCVEAHADGEDRSRR